MTLGLCCLGTSLMATERPNIIWIFSDDHTSQAIGAYEGILSVVDPTPNIDRLAREGMRFDRTYVGNSICAPARATLLTGKHSHLHGKIDNMNPFDHDQPQFQKILQENGYQTAMVGKIHLDGTLQGFDYWDVLPGQGDYYQPVFITEAGRTAYEGYVTDIITEKSLDWLKHQRDENKPFMLMIIELIRNRFSGGTGTRPLEAGLKERFHGGKGSKPSRRCQLLAKTGCERNQAVDETDS